MSNHIYVAHPVPDVPIVQGVVVTQQPHELLSHVPSAPPLTDAAPPVGGGPSAPPGLADERPVLLSLADVGGFPRPKGRGPGRASGKEIIKHYRATADEDYAELQQSDRSLIDRSLVQFVQSISQLSFSEFSMLDFIFGFCGLKSSYSTPRNAWMFVF